MEPRWRCGACDPLLLEQPAPIVTYSGFGSSGLQLDIYVWAARENFLSVKNNLQANILDEIREALKPLGYAGDYEMVNMMVRPSSG